MARRGRPKIFYGWVIVGIAFVCYAIGYVAWHSFSLFLVAFVQEFGWSRATTAGAFSLFTVIYGLSSPAVGALVDRFGPRVVLPGGAILLSLGLLAASRTSAAWQLYAAFGLMVGMGLNATGSIPNGAVLQNWFVRRRGIALGVAAAGVSVGVFLFIPVVQHIISTWGWRMAYIALGALILAVIPTLTGVFHRARPEDLGLVADGEVATRATEPAAAPQGRSLRVVDQAWASRRWTWRRAIRTRRYWLVFLGFSAGLFAHQVLVVHQVAYLVDAGHSRMLAATAVSLIGLVGALGKVFWGWLSDRLGREHTWALAAVIWVGSILWLMSIGDASQPWKAYAYGVLFGIGYASTAPMFPAIAADLFQGPRFGAIYGSLALGHTLGSSLGPVLAGHIFDTTGSYTVAFSLAIAAMVLASGSFWLAAPREVRAVGKKALLPKEPPYG